MEERRRTDDANWDRLNQFIGSTQAYRDTLNDKLTSIETQVKKTNGRVDALEDFQKNIEQKMQDKKDHAQSNMALITLIATVVMAVSALIVIFKK